MQASVSFRGAPMYTGKLVFSQVMECAPWQTFRRLVAKYRADFNVRTFTCLDQFLSMAFAQITYRESLRDIEACLEAHATKAYHLGLRGHFTRSNLADANAARDWRLHCEFAQARFVSRDDCTPPNPWVWNWTTLSYCAGLHHHRLVLESVPVGTALDQGGDQAAYAVGLARCYPQFYPYFRRQMDDVNVLDLLLPEAGAFYVMDRGYLDFARLYGLHQSGVFFVTCAKCNMNFQRVHCLTHRSQH